jgi:hypothetical protein
LRPCESAPIAGCRIIGISSSGPSVETGTQLVLATSADLW